MKMPAMKPLPLLLSSLICISTVSGCKEDDPLNTETPIRGSTGLITAVAGEAGIQVSVEGYDGSQGAEPIPITVFAKNREPLATSYAMDSTPQTLAVENPNDISALFLGNTLIIYPPQQTELYLNRAGQPNGNPRIIPSEPIHCFDKQTPSVHFDTNNLADPYATQRLWFSSGYADITYAHLGMEAQLCSDLGPSILIDSISGVFSQLSGDSIDAIIESPNTQLGNSKYLIPAPTALPSIDISLQTGWPVDQTRASIVKTVNGKPGLWLQHDAIERVSKDSIIPLPYIPNNDTNEESYHYEITSSVDLLESPFGDNAYNMQNLFGHLDQKFARSVGNTTIDENTTGISPSTPAFPFTDTIEGHGSALFPSERDDSEWDMLVMNFTVENSIHNQPGEKYSTVEVLMPISSGLPQIFVLALADILENIGDAYHATSIAVRDYESVTTYDQAVHNWSRKGMPYTEVGLHSKAEETLLIDVQYTDLGMKTCIERAAKKNNWLSVSDVTALDCEHVGKARGFFMESPDGIDSTVDIAQFTHLKKLSLRGHYYTSIDVSTLTELTLLNLASSYIQDIDLSQNTQHETLNLTGTVIPTLDRSMLKHLKALYASKKGLDYDEVYHEEALRTGEEHGYDFKITQDIMNAGIVDIIHYDESALEVFER